MASLRDLVTVVYRPRETMRRVLDGGRDRWAIQVVVLATICAAVGDTDIRELRRALPDLTIESSLALVVLTLLLTAACWVVVLYLFAWVATLVGRRLEGQGEVADVRAALAWGVVPVIWSAMIRIPLAIYRYGLVPDARDPHRLVMDLISNGGCTFAIMVLTFQTLLIAWMAYVASSTVGEALRFSSWKGLATIAIVVAVPVVIGVAAQLASKT